MLLDHILFNVPCPIFWKSLDGTFLGCDKAFLAVSDFHDYSQLIGKKDEDLPWKLGAEQYYDDDQYVITTGETIKKIENIFLKDRMIVSETTKTPLLQGDKIIGVLGFCLDITAKKEKERLKTQNIVYEAEIKCQKVFKNRINGIYDLLQQAKIDAVNTKGVVQIEITDYDKEITITKREREILYFLSMGNTPKEIASILSVIEDKAVLYSTISAFINKQLYPKFNVFSINQLVEKATLLKLIPFLNEKT